MRRRLALLALALLLAGSALAQEVTRQSHGLVDRVSVRLTPADGLVVGDTGASARLAVPLDARPFLGLGITWDGPDRVRVRTSTDGTAWTAWTDLHADPHGRDGARPLRSALTTADAAVRWVEVAVPRAPGETVDALTVAFVSPGDTPTADRAAALGPDRPAVVSRTAWGCPDGQASPTWTPQPIEVSHIAVHHTAGGGTWSDYAAYVRLVWDLHTHSNGWGDIGYNYLVDPDGVVYEGRAGGSLTVDVQGAHALGSVPGTSANPYSMGVGMIGTYTSGVPSPEATASLVALAAWKVGQKGLDAEATTPMPSIGPVPVLFGHRDVSSTECPGTQLYGQMSALRTAVADAQGVSIVVSGSRGVRYLGPPAAGVTVDNLAAQNLVRGVPGYYPAAEPPNLFTSYDTATGTWVASAGTGETLALGRAVRWYFFDRAVGNPAISRSVELPFTLTTTRPANTADVTVELATSGGRFNMLANPFGTDLDLSSIGTWPGTENLAPAPVETYDASTHTWVGAPASVPPWTAFRVRAKGPRVGGQPRLLTIPATAARPAASIASAPILPATRTPPAGLVALRVVPNPSAGRARVAFYLAESGPVRLSVLDARGREVAVLTDGSRLAGRHEVPLGALAPGVYLLRLSTEAGVVTQTAAVAR